ncbi:MAG: BufA1 family periplasmic bufferin-type metallophore [Steroidobacteraceae bacterium]
MAAVAAAIAALIAEPTSAQVHPEKPTYKYEKCYGIAKAGMNDCFFANNSCAGTVTSDNVPGAWIYVPQGTCAKIVGGSLQPPATMP